MNAAAISEHVPSTETAMVALPKPLWDSIQAEARQHGLEPANYLFLLNEMQRKSFRSSFIQAVREVQTKDRGILARLAK